MPGDAFRTSEERFEFVMENSLKVGHGNLVVAFPTEVFARAVADIHFVTATAVGDVPENLRRQRAGAFPALRLFFDDLVDLFPQTRLYDGFARHLAPFA